LAAPAESLDSWVRAGRELAEWPKREEYLEGAKLAGIPEFFAAIDWARCEERKWQGIQNWRSRVADPMRLPQWWREAGCPQTLAEFQEKKNAGPGKSSRSAAKPINPVAQKIALEQFMAVHPANQESTSAVANATPEQRAEFKQMKNDLNALIGQIAKGHRA
jgi:hypothetical protein